MLSTVDQELQQLSEFFPLVYNYVVQLERKSLQNQQHRHFFVYTNHTEESSLGKLNNEVRVISLLMLLIPRKLQSPKTFIFFKIFTSGICVTYSNISCAFNFFMEKAYSILCTVFCFFNVF